MAEELTAMERNMTDKTKLCILVEIELDRPLKSSLEVDVARRLERSAYDLIVARGGDCRDAKATIQKQVNTKEGEKA
jgi:hypothetical protein